MLFLGVTFKHPRVRILKYKCFFEELGDSALLFLIVCLLVLFKAYNNFKCTHRLYNCHYCALQASKQEKLLPRKSRKCCDTRFVKKVRNVSTIDLPKQKSCNLGRH